MRYYRWDQEHCGEESPIRQWYLEIQLTGLHDWNLRSGQLANGWSPACVAWTDADRAYSDFPVTSDALPVYSPRLKTVIDQNTVGAVQYLPLPIKHRSNGLQTNGYQLANYLQVLDCLDRERSTFQVWTKENLLFWEKRPWMLGTFRDVQRVTLDVSKIGDSRLFRLWGWEAMTIVREDVKQAIEAAGITGCWFKEVIAS